MNSTHHDEPLFYSAQAASGREIRQSVRVPADSATSLTIEVKTSEEIHRELFSAG